MLEETSLPHLRTGKTTAEDRYSTGESPCAQLHNLPKLLKQQGWKQADKKVAEEKLVRSQCLQTDGNTKVK